MLEDINPLRALNLFENIRNEEIILFDMKESYNHPKDLIITRLLVPPVCIRPSVIVSEGMTNEDDLTMKI